MSSVNYSLNHKGVRVISSQEAWVIGKNGNSKLNPKYTFLGKINVKFSNFLITASDKKKPTYKGDANNLNIVAKKQLVSHFFNDKGKRNEKYVAYCVIPKKAKK